LIDNEKYEVVSNFPFQPLYFTVSPLQLKINYKLSSILQGSTAVSPTGIYYFPPDSNLKPKSIPLGRSFKTVVRKQTSVVEKN
jgi:hypothetical protein